MKPFAYERADDVRGAVAALAAQGEGARFLAGGTNLVDHLKLGVESATALVDVSRALPAAIDDAADGGLRIGAGVRNADLAHDERVRRRYAALSQALLAGASGQLRNVATTGGNLLQRTRCAYFRDPSVPACNKRDPGSGCAALAPRAFTRYHAILGGSEHCIATHPSDMAVAMLAFDATVTTDLRALPLSELHRLPGDAPQHDTVLEHGELITGVELPAFDGFSVYRKVRDRASYAFALVSVAVAADRDGAVRIAFGGVAHAPWRATRAEAVLRDGGSAGQAAEAEFGDDVVQTTPGNAFKPTLARRLLVDTLEGVAPA